MGITDSEPPVQPDGPAPVRDCWRFGDPLESLEEAMCKAAEAGEAVEPAADSADAISVTIRAAVLRHLLVSKDWEVAAKGVCLRGVRLTGRLDLSGARVRCGLRMESCYLDGDLVNLDYADVPALSFIKCHLPEISGKTLTVRTDLSLSGSKLTGPVRLQIASVAGDLDCSNTRLEGTGDALSAAAAKVTGNVILDEAVTTVGGIDLEGAVIDGALNCRGARLEGVVKRYDDSTALFAQWIKVGGPVRLNANFTATHTVFLLGADIRANLNCKTAQMNGSGIALQAEQMKLGGNFLAHGLRTGAARITLTGADISGSLNCVGAELNPRMHALHGERLKVHGDVTFTSDPRQEQPEPLGQGEIWLTDAEIDGNLTVKNVVLKGSECALNGERLTVHGNVSFESIGSPKGAICLRGANINGTLRWVPGEPVSEVSLADATAGRLEDDWTKDNGCWPTNGRLDIRGFTYGGFTGGAGQASVTQRLDWIRSQWPGYEPNPARHPRPGMPSAPAAATRFPTQPYEQLATIYQQAGQDNEAREVALERRRDTRRYGNLTSYRRALNWLLDKTIRYGYQTWRAVLMLAVVYAVAVAVFWTAQHHGNLIVPLMQTSSGKRAPPATSCTSSYPCFYPAGYAIDTVIPIINVHQSTFWGPNGHARWGYVLTAFTWVCTALGWALATLTVAGYTGLVRNSDDL